MADPLGIDLRSTFGGEFHQVDAAARRIHFLAPEDVSGTGRQAEAAVHALINDFRGGGMVPVEDGWKRIGRRRHGSV